MTISYWCILAAIIMPYVLAPIGQLPGMTYKGFGAPRARWETFTGWKLRANSAHLNSFEVLPGFIAAVLIAHQTGVPQGTIDALAMTFIAARILYAVLFIAGFTILRTITWLSGFACVVALFVLSA